MCAYVYKGEYVCMYAQMRKYCVSKNIIYFLCLKEKIGHTLEKKRKSEKKNHLRLTERKRKTGCERMGTSTENRTEGKPEEKQKKWTW